MNVMMVAMVQQVPIVFEIVAGMENEKFDVFIMMMNGKIILVESQSSDLRKRAVLFCFVHS